MKGAGMLIVAAPIFATPLVAVELTPDLKKDVEVEKRHENNASEEVRESEESIDDVTHRAF